MGFDPSEKDWWFDVSPDGSRIARANRASSVPRPFARNRPCRVPKESQLASLHGAQTRQIKVKGWSYLVALAWASDGKSLFVVASQQRTRTVLHVDLDGNAQPMWVALGATGETLASPSPDGRHLALQTWTNNGNLWMLENF